MNDKEIESIAKGFAPVMRDLVEAKTRPLERRIEWLERKLAAMEANDDAARLAIEGSDHA